MEMTELNHRSTTTKTPKSPKSRAKSPLSISDPYAISTKTKSNSNSSSEQQLQQSSNVLQKMSKNSTKFQSKSMDIPPPLKESKAESNTSLFSLLSLSTQSSSTNLNGDKKSNLLELKIDTLWRTYKARISPLSRHLELYLEVFF